MPARSSATPVSHARSKMPPEPTGVSVKEAVYTLLRASQPVTPDAICRMTGKPYHEVIAVLADNEAMLRFDEKGRVEKMRVRDYSLQWAFKEGKTYRTEDFSEAAEAASAAGVDPDEDNLLKFTHPELHDRLKITLRIRLETLPTLDEAIARDIHKQPIPEQYGAEYEDDVVLNTPENRAALEAAGLVHEDDFDWWNDGAWRE